MLARSRKREQRKWTCSKRREAQAKKGKRGPEEILIYTIGVLTSLKNGRLIAQSRIIRRFRVTKLRRGGLYQLDVCANAKEKVEKRARGRIRHTGEGRGNGVLGGRNAGACTPGRNEC